MKPYILKRKDEDIAVINIAEDGAITDYRLIEENGRLAPPSMAARANRETPMTH